MPSDSPALEVITPGAIPEPVAPVVTETPAAPVVAPVEAPIVVVAPEPAPVVTPVETSVEAPVAEPALVPHTDVKSLLSDAGKPPETPEVTPPEVVDPTKPVETAEVAPMVYTDFKVPDGLGIEASQLDGFKTLIGEARIPQEMGQKLLDKYFDQAQQFVTSQLQKQHEVFRDTRAQWVNEVRTDPEMGGAAFNTTMASAARMIDQFVSPDRRPAFFAALDATGAGDHPEIVRFMSNLAKFFDEPAPPSTAYRPPPDIGKPVATGRRGLGSLYDKPMQRRGG